MSALSPARTVRLAMGGVAAAACLAVGVALVTVTLPGRTQEAIAVDAQPPATPSVATCAGPVLATGRDASQAALLTDAAAPLLTEGAAGDATVAQRPLAAPDVTGGAGPSVLTAEPVGAERTDLAAAGSARVGESDLAGFAASACTRAAMESWLVSGTATTGSADLVVLANPTDVAALVSLTVFGASGETAPAAGKGIVVAAGTQRVIPLAALALGEEDPIVRVTSSQAPVQASLQSTLTRVLVPGGLDQVAAVGAPADDLVIPGVAVTLAPGDAGASDVPTSLRLLAPATDGTATVTIAGADGPVGDPQVVPLTAGVPLQLDLGGLPIGTYTVSVHATAPVTGAVWATTGFGEGSDFGWFTGADLLSASTLVAVADGPSPRLTLASTAGDPQTITVEGVGGGAAREVSLAPGATATIAVDGDTVYRVVTDGKARGVRAAVTFSGDGAIAGYAVPAGDAAASAITVYPR